MEAVSAAPESPEVIMLSRDEYDRAVTAALAGVGLSYLELRAQARSGNFLSLRACKLWLAIGEQ